MNIALIGYGKMGKIIEEIAKERQHTIVLKLQSKDTWNAHTLIQSKADVAIEFTNPESAKNNILQCFDANIPVVVGTTGWYNLLDEIKKICSEKNQTLLYASNFSIGVNLFFKINEYIAQLMSKHADYSVSLTEAHHTEKKDAPSGTAISIAQSILQYYPEKSNWSLSPEKNKLHISARRCGDEKGYHAVYYKSTMDEIQLSHHAYSRKGFALGAVLAAEFIQNKKGCFTMQDVLKL